MSARDIRYSLIIPYYNEEKVLPDLLGAAAKLRNPDQFELVMVDNNSVDKGPEIVKSYQGKIKHLVAIKETRQGIGASRKSGAEHSHGQILVTGDADVTFPPDYLEQFGMVFSENSHTVGVVGLYYFTDKSRFFNWCWQRAMIFFDYINRLLTGTFAFRGLVAASRREDYFAVGGFNHDISALEDVELSLRLKKRGKIRYAPHIQVATSYRRFRGRFIRQLIKRLKAYFYRAILRNNTAESEWERVG